MKLIYRGTTYDYNPGATSIGNTGRPVRANSVAQAPYTLIYRGQKLHVDPNLPMSEVDLPSSYDLIYRGATYRVGQPTPAHSSVTVPAAMPIRFLNKVHQANLQENLQRRLKVAQAKGDQHLIELLEAEQRQIAA